MKRCECVQRYRDLKATLLIAVYRFYKAKGYTAKDASTEAHMSCECFADHVREGGDII